MDSALRRSSSRVSASPSELFLSQHITFCVFLIMWIGKECYLMAPYGVLVVLATQIAGVFARCAITPDANGHVNVPSSWSSIPYEAFYGCSSMMTVTIPDNIETIERRAFENCLGLKSVIIPNSVKELG